MAVLASGISQSLRGEDVSSHIETPIDESAAQLESLRAQYYEAPPHRMTPLLNSLLVGRDRLIKDNPEHPDNVFWRLAQLEDALLKGVAFNALEYRVRYGLPDPTEVVHMEKLLRVALEQAMAIDRELPGLIEAATGNRLLIERLTAIRDNRIPYLKGMALLLAADQSLVPDTSLARGEAIRLLSDEGMQLRTEERINAGRYLAEAYAAEGDLDRSKEILKDLLMDLQEPTFERLGLLLSQYEIEAIEDPETAAARSQLRLATTGKPSHRMLLSEQSAKHWIEASQGIDVDAGDPASLEAHAQLEGSAFEVFLLLQPEQGGIVVPDNQDILDQFIEQRLGRLQIRDLSASHVPPSVVVAQVLPMLDDPGRLTEAYELITPLIDRKGLSPRIQSRLLAVAMRMKAMMNRHAEAVEVALRWSEVAQSREEAHTAAGMAAAMATEALRRSTDDAQLRAAKRKSINHLLENFSDHPDINQWRFEAGIMEGNAGAYSKSNALYDSIDLDSQFRVRAVGHKANSLIAQLSDGSVTPEAIEQARESVKNLLIENNEHMKTFRKQAKLSRVNLNFAAAQIELFDSNPVKALEYLGRIQTNILSPEIARSVHGAQLDASIRIGRPEATRAVIDMMPLESRSTILPSNLAGLLAEPGEQLPLDPLSDHSQKEMVRCLVESMVNMDVSNVSQMILIMDGYRRIDEPEEAIQWSNRVLNSVPDLAPALFAKAESLVMMSDGDLSEAIKIYTRLSKMDPAEDHNIMWTSNLRLLQLMLEDGRSQDAITARLNRLQRQYPDLGGHPYIGNFALVRSGLKDAILP